MMIQVVSFKYTDTNPDNKYVCTVQMDNPEEINSVRQGLCGTATNPYKNCKLHKYISKVIFSSVQAKKEFLKKYTRVA